MRAKGRVHAAAMLMLCAGCRERASQVLCETCLHDIEELRLPRASGAVFAYAPPLRQALLAWKHGDRPALTRFFCDAMKQAAPAADVVVPIPPALLRTIWRGMHAPTELARAIGPVHRHALVRLRQARQMGLSRQGRQRGRLFIATPFVQALSGKRVLLVDDVVTTGATLAAAREALGLGLACESLALARVER